MPSKAKMARNRKSASLRSNMASRQPIKEPPLPKLPTRIFNEWVTRALKEYTPTGDHKSLLNIGNVGWQEGGINGGDFHTWCEDMEGNVVGDTHFSYYDMCCAYHGADPKRPVYQKWPNQEKWLKEKDADDNSIQFYKMMPESAGHFKKWYRKPEKLNCKNNAIAYKLFSGVECKIVVGSMGWKYKHKKGIWWEFG